MTSVGNVEKCTNGSGSQFQGERWGLLWRSVNQIDGTTEHLIYENCLPVLFQTCTEARDYAKRKYGYILRPDLRAEPFGWRLPKAVRVEITVKQSQSATAA
jgi:hypothetical protein